MLLTAPTSAAAQVRHLAEMTAEEIRTLDRATTAVIIPGGIVDENGPHLPSFSGGYSNRAIADSPAAAIARRPGCGGSSAPGAGCRRRRGPSA